MVPAANLFRHAAFLSSVAGVLSIFFCATTILGSNVTLAWNPSPDTGPTVAGYRLYYGTVSQQYSAMIDAGNADSLTVSNLVAGTTYYFAVTSYTDTELESAFSGEVVYTVPAPAAPPTIDPLADLTISENAAQQILRLSGISAGAGNQSQLIGVTATSSNPNLVPNPVVDYTSPNSTGAITFAPAMNTFGSAVLTVTVTNNSLSNNMASSAFTVTVNPNPAALEIATNAVVAPNSTFWFALNAPIASAGGLNLSLDAGAPTGAQILTRSGVAALVWTPSVGQASTTNLIDVIITNAAMPDFAEHQAVIVVVQNLLTLSLGATSVEAGQTANVPIYLSSSDGVSSLTFAVGWPFDTPPSISMNGVLSTLLNQATNLLVTIQAGLQPIQGSNLIGELSFQTSPLQASGFSDLPVQILGALDANQSPYLNFGTAAGRVALVGDVPLLQAAFIPGQVVRLTLLGSVGASYGLQYATNLNPLVWYDLLDYSQTSSSQTLDLAPTNPLTVFRLIRR